MQQGIETNTNLIDSLTYLLDVDFIDSELETFSQFKWPTYIVLPSNNFMNIKLTYDFSYENELLIIKKE